MGYLSKKEAIDILIAHAICCSNTDNLTCEQCPRYNKDIAENDNNTNPCHGDYEEDLEEAVLMLLE